MESITSLLKSKAKDIELDKRREDLEVAKDELERFMNTKQAKVAAITDKTLTVRVRSSVLASELRMMQYNLRQAISKSLDRQITRVIIKTG